MTAPDFRPFTLRTVSVYSTGFEEIGVLRFDASLFTELDIALVAEMEVSIAGQTAELELRELTSSGLIAKLACQTIVTQKQSTGPLQLPRAEILYGVRLRRVLGSNQHRVSCRSVGFELRTPNA